VGPSSRREANNLSQLAGRRKFPGWGSHFDPGLVEVFLEIEDEFLQIAMDYHDDKFRR
jgi:hypothetical protein